MKRILWWALKSPRGRLFLCTIRATKMECWEHGFSMVGSEQPTQWMASYWKRWDASMKSALRLGYKFVRVEIKEAK